MSKFTLIPYFRIITEDIMMVVGIPDIIVALQEEIR